MSLDLRKKTITIIGLGRSGIAVAKLALAQGARVKISDIGSQDRLHRVLQEAGLTAQVALEHDQHTEQFIQDSDLVVLSPGVRSDVGPVQWAKERSIPVIGEVELAWHFCPCKIIAVTGSNGKTTTVTLIQRILQQANRSAILCGNIGRPFSECVSTLQPSDFLVLEISSFQLETTKQFKPHVAVFLNFSKNHLDRHQDLQEYFQAKARIFENQTQEDFAILNIDEPLHRDLAKRLSAQVHYYNHPQERLQPDENPNFLAAKMACRVLGIPDTIATQVFSTFQGVEHRQEFVRTLQGVDYINDSKATTAEAGAWALKRFTRPIIWICGGHDKGPMDLSTVCILAKEKVKKIIVLTREDLVRQRLHDAFGNLVHLEDHTDLQQAVFSARESAQPGDLVLFSPMFASFDMFENFEHRGNAFKEMVHRL